MLESFSNKVAGIKALQNFFAEHLRVTTIKK